MRIVQLAGPTQHPGQVDQCAPVFFSVDARQLPLLHVGQDALPVTGQRGQQVGLDPALQNAHGQGEVGFGMRVDVIEEPVVARERRFAFDQLGKVDHREPGSQFAHRTLDVAGRPEWRNILVDRPLQRVMRGAFAPQVGQGTAGEEVHRCLAAVDGDRRLEALQRGGMVAFFRQRPAGRDQRFPVRQLRGSQGFVGLALERREIAQVACGHNEGDPGVGVRGEPLHALQG